MLDHALHGAVGDVYGVDAGDGEGLAVDLAVEGGGVAFATWSTSPRRGYVTPVPR
ncbi:hypothetical protein BH23ACT9_BH23ACT9_04030 [soil metagenome]